VIDHRRAQHVPLRRHQIAVAGDNRNRREASAALIARRIMVLDCLDVAVNLLPPTFAAEPNRLARFEREARVTRRAESTTRSSQAAIDSAHDGCSYELKRGAVSLGRWYS
jgi:hypothetical protein